MVVGRGDLSAEGIRGENEESKLGPAGFDEPNARVLGFGVSITFRARLEYNSLGSMARRGTSGG